MSKLQRHKSGVYLIRNTTTRKVYVGSSIYCILNRWVKHKLLLSRGKHHSIHLQRAWYKYGSEAFDFSVIEYCPSADCLSREQYWIDHLKASHWAYGYNGSSVAGNRTGLKHSFETRQKISKANKGRIHTKETREKMSASRKEVYALDKEYKKRISDGIKKYYKNPMARLARSEATRKGWVTRRIMKM